MLVFLTKKVLQLADMDELLDKQWYVLRGAKSLHYSSGGGKNATPKLYSRGSALTQVKVRNAAKFYSAVDGPWECVPVKIEIKNE